MTFVTSGDSLLVFFLVSVRDLVVRILRERRSSGDSFVSHFPCEFFLFFWFSKVEVLCEFLM